MELINKTNYVDIAISKSTSKMLNIIEFIDCTEYPIDKIYIDKFWASLNDNELLYATNDIIMWMGFNSPEKRYNKKMLIKLLTVNEVEYITYSNDEYANYLKSVKNISIYPPPLPGKGSGIVKHLLLPADSLKLAMMLIGRGKGKHIREYYIALEKLMKVYMQYQIQYESSQVNLQAINEQLKSVNDQLLIERNKNIMIENMINNVQLLEKTEYVYIATSNYYASQNIFKFGRTTNIRARIITYNTGRADEDNLYYCWIHKCHDSVSLESLVKSYLTNWQRNKHKEMYMIHYDFLYRFVEFICHNEDLQVNMINKFINTEMVNTLSILPTIPPPLTEFEGITLPTTMLITSSVDPDNEVILTVELTRRQVKNIIIEAFNRSVDNNKVSFKELYDAIKSLLGTQKKKTKFRVNEWNALCLEISKELNICIYK